MIRFSGVITSIPDAVLGGMTIFLFANVLTSGIGLAATLDLNSRRNKFILAMSLAVGVGVSVWPFAFQDMRASNYTANFWRCGDCNPTLKGIRNGVSIFLSTGYCVGTVIAMLLNFLLPEDSGVSRPNDAVVTMLTEDEVKKDSTVRTTKTSQMDQDATGTGKGFEEEESASVSDEQHV
jgi:uric acid-xanthine permease